MEPVDGLNNAEHEGPGKVIYEVGEPGLDVCLVLDVLVPVVTQLLGVQDVRACEWLRCGTSCTCKRLYCAVVVGLCQPGIG